MAKVVIAEGIERETLAIGEKMMVVEFRFSEGAEHQWHSHRHEQSCYIVKGKLKLFVEDQVIVLTQGMSAIVPPDAKHKALALEDTVNINVFSPIREDFI